MNANPVKEIYTDLNRLTGDRLHIIVMALESFAATRAAQAAAGLAFYAFFSLFPLLLLFIIGGSYFLDSQRVFMSVTHAVQDILPVSQQFVSENLRHVLEERGPVGLVVLVTLLWSASAVFINLAFNINLAWPLAAKRTFLKNRLIGLGMIAGLSALLILSIILDWLARTIASVNFFNASFSDWGLWRLLSGLGSWLMVFLLFLALYRWVPAIYVRWRASFWGAAVASIGWKIATAGFAWYVDSGFGRYQLIYGSLGAIVAFLFLVYLISLITLFGAHLTAAIDQWQKQKLSEATHMSL